MAHELTTTTDWQAKKAARASAASAMQAAFPHLVPIGGKVDSLQAAAKNIRIELARAFPGVKFSVKSSRFSMGDSISVRWTDGPVARQVEEITGCYSAGSFDGMTDCYNYSRDAWTDAFGSAKYVNEEREYSDKAITSCARLVFSKWGVDMAKFPADGVVASFRSGALRSIRQENYGNWDLGDLIYQELARRTFAITRGAA